MTDKERCAELIRQIEKLKGFVKVNTEEWMAMTNELHKIYDKIEKDEMEVDDAIGRRDKIKSITGSYEDWLIKSLRDGDEAVGYLKAVSEQFLEEPDIGAFLYSVDKVIKAGWGNDE